LSGRAKRRLFAISSCAAGAWPQIQIVQLCAYALIAGQRDVFVAWERQDLIDQRRVPVLNDS
jgi:hypothetical protein